MSTAIGVRRILAHWLTICLCRLILGGVFIAAALPKIYDPATFAESIENYHIMPAITLNFMAITLPWIELIAGAGLIMGLWPRSNIFIINGLLVVFMIAILSALIRKIDINCGCFGAKSEELTIITFVRDLLLFGTGIILWLYDPGWWRMFLGRIPSHHRESGNAG
jgi:uncharacterized membrane protein YphA (DoxX/SURF4 family)